MAANFQDVANQFVPFYYQTFDTNREALATLYRDTSMLTYESASVVGVAAIVDKLKVRPPIASTIHVPAQIQLSIPPALQPLGCCCPMFSPMALRDADPYIYVEPPLPEREA